MLKSDENRIIINDFIQGEPLSEESLDKTLDIVNEFNKRYRIKQNIVLNKDNDRNILNKNVNKIRLLMPEKTIWLYTGYTWEEIMNYQTEFSNKNFMKIPNDEILYDYHMFQRKQIISNCSVMVDGRYIDSQCNISAKWKGSDNQRVIDVKKSLQQKEVVLYCD